MQSKDGQYRNEMYKSAENMIPQLDGTLNVSDSSDTDSHSYLDLAGTNIIIMSINMNTSMYLLV